MCVCVRGLTVATTLGCVSRCQRPSAVPTAAQPRPIEARQFGPHQGALCECLTSPAPKHPPSTRDGEQVTISTLSAVKPPLT